MSEIKHSKSTDSENKIKLDSSLIFAAWRNASAFAGRKAEFEIGTAFVGEGADIQITGKSEKGKKLGKIRDIIKNNVYTGDFDIPDDCELGDEIYFEVKLSKNGIDGRSNSIPVHPAPVVKNIKWSADEARRGNQVTMSADVEKVHDGTEVIVTVYEHDRDGAHDRITELPAIVNGKKTEVTWEFEYLDATVAIPTEGELQQYDKKNHYAQPEYFFTLNIGGEEYGRKQESGFLRFIDRLRFRPLGESGEPFPGAEYIIYLADGTEKKGKLDDNGEAVEEDLPPGQVTIVLPKEGYFWGRR
jgi:hypothetical protein